MKKTFENLKGTFDYLPEKQIIREKIKDTLKPVFIKYGFAPIETPIICSYDLLASKYSEGADILNEMYKLSDQGLRKLGLRYDLTITFSKLISSNSDITMPFKRYEIGRVYRDGPVKLGRNREFTQCDIDVVGVSNMMAEAEYMMMINEIYKKLDLNVEIEFNNRKILSGIISYVLGELNEKTMRQCIMLIDKLAKISKEELIKEFNAIGIESNKLESLLVYFNMNYDDLKHTLKDSNNNLIIQGFKEIDELNSYLSGTDAIKIMKFSPYLARGIDIYTGTVWEIFLKDRKINNQKFNLSIGGGGRYDKIITNFIDDGNQYPAVGMSFGLDVIYEILVLKDSSKKISTVDLYIIPLETEIESFKFASELRYAGLKVEIDKNVKKLKKSLSYADRMNIPYVIIIGETEIDSKKILIKNMINGKSEEFGMNEIESIKGHIINRK